MFDHLPRTNFGGPFDSTSVTPARNSHIVTQAMRLFLVWDSEGISEKTDTIMEDLFSACDCDTDSEGGRKTKSKGSKDKKRKKAKSSSSDGDEESSESGSSSKKKPKKA